MIRKDDLFKSHPNPVQFIPKSDGSAPLATPTVSGTVKIDTADADPDVYIKTTVDTLLAAKAATVHPHAAADITSGQLAMARIASGAPDGTKFVRDDGVLATPPAGGTPIATAAVTGTVKTNTTVADPVVYRVSEVDTLLAGKASTTHATTHQPGGADAMAVDAVAATGSLRTLGTGAQQAAAGNDTRLSDARTPLAHATSHNAGGSDAMAIDAAAATGSLRTLGTGATQAAAGNHTHAAVTSVNGDAGPAVTLAMDEINWGAGANPFTASTSQGIDDELRTTKVSLAGQIGGTFSSPTVLGLRETAGPTLLTNGAIPDESVLTRSGTSIVGKKWIRKKLAANQAAIGTTATSITSLVTALEASKAYGYKAFIIYTQAATTNLSAYRVGYTGTLAAAASGQSVAKIKGGSGITTVWAEAYRGNTNLVNAAMPTTAGGITSGGTTAPAVVEIEGTIFTNAAGNLEIYAICSAAAALTINAGSQIEVWEAT